MSFQKAYDLVIELEGGEVETNPPEGRTYAGILQPDYEAWCKQQDLFAQWPPPPLFQTLYYKSLFWEPFHCADFPENADAVVFQMAVNLPSVRARQLIQIAVLAYPDGDLGPKTIEAIKKCGFTAEELEKRILLLQQLHYCDVRPVGDPNFTGLQNRVSKVADWLWPTPAPA